jgi:hypothetical protein
MAQVAPDVADPGLKAGLGQGRRCHGGDAPVLAQRIEEIGRSADRGLAHRDVGKRPGERARRVHADGKVAIEADAHAGRPAGRLGDLQLLVREPLQPDEESDALSST